jgi:hypothetical protein
VLTADDELFVVRHAAGEHPPPHVVATPAGYAQRGSAQGRQPVFPAPVHQHPAVTPHSQCAGQCVADADQPNVIRDVCDADVLRVYPIARCAELLLGRLDRLPAFLDGRQVPPMAQRTDHPQAPLPTVECERPAYRELLDDVVAAESV